jgi:CDP-diacylglycerol--glycerol-3-phosphate 3-phosphatidyltransferase
MNLPNQLSLLRIFLTPVFIILLFLDGVVFRIGSFIIFIIASLTDCYDGYTARKFSNVTLWGQFLDPLADKILISSGLICFSILGYIPKWMVLIIVIRDLLITGLRYYAILKGKPIITNFLSKIKTASQFIAIHLIFLYHLLIVDGPNKELNGLFQRIQETDFIFVIMYGITLLTVISGFIYILNNRSNL